MAAAASLLPSHAAASRLQQLRGSSLGHSGLPHMGECRQTGIAVNGQKLGSGDNTGNMFGYFLSVMDHANLGYYSRVPGDFSSKKIRQPGGHGQQLLLCCERKLNGTNSNRALQSLRRAPTQGAAAGSGKLLRGSLISGVHCAPQSCQQAPSSGSSGSTVVVSLIHTIGGPPNAKAADVNIWKTRPIS